MSVDRLALRRAQHLARRKIGARVVRAMLKPGRFVLTNCPHLVPCVEAA